MKGGDIIGIAWWVAFFALAVLGGCDESPNSKEYRQYAQERTLYRVCNDGTRIYQWDGQYWTPGANQWPDTKVSDPDRVCAGR